MTTLLSRAGWLIITLLAKTLRVRDINAKPWGKALGGPTAVFAFWHGEQFVLVSHHKQQGIGIMSSLSRDGEIQTGIMRRFGYTVIRGSSSRGGERALVEMIRLARKGHSMAFAVDGPRGPYQEVKPGVVFLALKAGHPLIPVSVAAERRFVLAKAWDRYELPKPFSRAVVMYGEPFTVNGPDDVEACRQRLQDEMREMSRFTHGAAWSRDALEYIKAHPRPKILIVQPSRIGDVIFTMPALAALRRTFPKAWIGWIVDERCAPVLAGSPDLDEVIVFDRSKATFDYVRAMRLRLRDLKLDLSIDFHGLFKSAFLVQLAGARFRLASSSTNGMRELSWLFSKEIKPPAENTHCVERHFAVARYLGYDGELPRPNIAIPEAARLAVDRELAKTSAGPDRPFVVIHPGGGWTSRRWFPQRFAQLIERLITQLGADVALVGGREGGAGEQGLNEEIIAAARVPVIDLTGRLSLKELAALLSRSSVFIANEAGPMHLAGALGVPSVALLGPTDPARTGPYGGTVTVVRHIVECQPCRERNCSSRKCMQLITVDEVFAKAREHIERWKEQRKTS